MLINRLRGKQYELGDLLIEIDRKKNRLIIGNDSNAIPIKNEEIQEFAAAILFLKTEF